MSERDLEPLNPDLGPSADPAPDADPPSPVGWHGAVVRRWLVSAVVLLVIGLLVSSVGLARTSADRASLRQRLEQAQAATANAAKEADELRRRTRFPAIDPHMSSAVLLAPNRGLVSTIVVLIAPEDFSKVWLMVDAVGAGAGTTYTLTGGSCTNTFPSLDWVAGQADQAGKVHLLAGPLRIDPADANVWARLHRGDQDFGGVRGPLASPHLVLPDEPRC